MSKYQPKRIYIDSSDRPSQYKSNDFQVSISNNKVISDVESIQMDSLIFPNSIYSINSNNNVFYTSLRRYSASNPTTFVERPCTVPLPIGHYTPQEIISALPVLIQDCYTAQYLGSPTLTISDMTYNTITKRFSISIAPQSYGRASSTIPGGDNIDWFIVLDQNYTGYPNGFKNSLNYVLGFEDQNHPTSITNYIDTPIAIDNNSMVLHRLSGISYVYLHCSLVNNSTSTSTNNNSSTVLSKISLPNEYGDIVFSHFGSSNDIIPIIDNKIYNIRFWITDSSFNIIDLNGSDFSFSLLINYN